MEESTPGGPAPDPTPPDEGRVWWNPGAPSPSGVEPRGDHDSAPEPAWTDPHLLPGGDGPVPAMSWPEAIAWAGYEPPRPSWPTAVVAGLLGAVVALAAAWALGAFDHPEPTTVATPAPSVVRPTINVSGAVTEVAVAVAAKVTPSIVSVEVGDADFGPDFLPQVSGSGVVIDDGLIVTNHHVITEGASVQVILQDGSVHEASVVGSDPETDLAVLEVDVAGLVPVEVGSTDDLTIGETAVAIGNPLGLSGGASLTVGVVSAFGRQIDTDIDSALYGMLQTDAPITEGSSGGALVDGGGELIGITTAIGVSSAGAEGIGFAVPVELVRRITDEIVATGEVRHAYLGVQLDNQLRPRPDGSLVPDGAVISGFSVDGDSVARDAGMRRGDVIVSLNGRRVTTREALISDLRMLAAGDVATFEVDRDGETLIFEVELAERPPIP